MPELEKAIKKLRQELIEARMWPVAKGMPNNVTMSHQGEISMKRWVSVAILITVGLGALLLSDRYYRGQIQAENERALEYALADVQNRLQSAVHTRLYSVEDLQAFMLAYPDLPDEQTFNHYTAALLDQYPEIRALQYADSGRIIRLIYPLEGNEAALNLDLMTRPAAPFVEKAIQEQRTTVADPELLVQGVLAIVARAPLYRDAEFLGLAQSVIDVDVLIAEALLGSDGRFEIQITDSAARLFWGPESLPGETQSVNLPVGDNTWNLTMGWLAPKPDAFILTLIWGLGGALLLSLVFIVNQAWIRMEWLRTNVERQTKELRQNEARYRDLVETAQDLIWQCDVEGRYTYLNPAWEDVFGYTIEEMLGKKFVDFQTPEYAERDLREFARLLRGDTVKGLETVHLGKDGREIHLVFNAKFLVDEEGNPSGTRGTAYDITKRVQADQALRENEENLRDLVENMLDGVAIVDENAHHIFTNLKFSEITGYSRDELLNMTGWDFTRPQDKAMLQQRMKDRVAGNPIPTYYDRIILRKDGTEVPVEMSTTVTIWQGKKRPMAIIHDITERQRAEMEMQALSSRQEAILASVPDIIMEVDNNKIYTWANQPGLQFFGEDVVGKEAAFYFEGEQDTYGTVQPLFNGAENMIYVESWQRRKDGKKRLLAWWCRILLDESGNVTGALSSARDITGRIEAEETIRRQRDELELRVIERTAQLEAFAYSVSHDLKAPLRGIHGYSSLLLKKYANDLDEEGKFFLENVYQAAENMRQLIDDLLAYSRMQRRDLVFCAVDLSEIVTKLLDEFAHQITTAQIDVQVDLPCERLQADVESLAQVLRNLISNAIKFSDQATAPRIEIGGKVEKNACILWVRDNGVGFDMRYHERIFAIFQRLHRVDEYPGTGIGLAIASKAMQRMSGRVWAESEPGRGATFYLEFPK